MIEVLVALVVLVPLCNAGLIAASRLLWGVEGDASERLTTLSSVFAAVISFSLLVALDVHALLNGVVGYLPIGTWFSSGNVTVRFNFMLDLLGLAGGTLVALIGFITLLFAKNYLHRESGIHRFFMVMNLFLAAMLLIVLAGNAIVMFIGWELAGVSSFLLIGYAFERTQATRNAVRAFVTTRIGDAGFILGIALSIYYARSSAWVDLAAQAQTLGAAHCALIAVGFLVAALAKSAQLPFSAWITRALEGPTPSSAVFYGSLMVHAGVFLCLRLEPILLQAPVLMDSLCIVGLLTLLYGFASGLTANDVKSALLFGTLTQTGIMFVAIGMGAFDLAAIHLIVHAVFRAWQFLVAPSYLHPFVGRRARLPEWVQGNQYFYTACLQRFWLEPLGDAIFVGPVKSLSCDLRTFDDQVVARLIGTPNVSDGTTRTAVDFVSGRGAAGASLRWFSEHLYSVEKHMLMQEKGGPARRALHVLGIYVTKVEQLLWRPVYLVAIVLAVFASVL